MGSKRKNGELKGVASRSMSPDVEDLLERGATARTVGDEVGRRLARVVDQLKKKHPDHHDVIMRQLEGQYARLLAERDKKKRLAREAGRSERSTDGTDGT